MVVRFDKKYLEELYTTGKCREKRYRFQPKIVKIYARRIKQLSDAERIEDLFPLNSLNYEVLSGDKEGVSSVRINDQYRLEFIVTTEGTEEPIITICTITDITNHYK